NTPLLPTVNWARPVSLPSRPMKSARAVSLFCCARAAGTGPASIPVAIATVSITILFMMRPSGHPLSMEAERIALCGVPAPSADHHVKADIQRRRGHGDLRGGDIVHAGLGNRANGIEVDVA